METGLGSEACGTVLLQFLQGALSGRTQAGQRLGHLHHPRWKEGPRGGRRGRGSLPSRPRPPSLAPEVPRSDSRRMEPGSPLPCLVSAALNSEGPLGCCRRGLGVRRVHCVPPAGGQSRQPEVDSASLAARCLLCLWTHKILNVIVTQHFFSLKAL